MFAAISAHEPNLLELLTLRVLLRRKTLALPAAVSWLRRTGSTSVDSSDKEVQRVLVD
jgi:hypothetical protein